MTPVTATPPVGIDGLTPYTIQALHEIRSHGGRPVARGEVMEALGLSVKRWQLAKAALLERGLISPVGELGDRRYVPTMGETGGAGSFDCETKPQIRARPPLVRVSAATERERRILRARILDHCSRRRLDARALASHLNAKLGDVEDILGSLLVENLVEHDRGGYRA